MDLRLGAMIEFHNIEEFEKKLNYVKSLGFTCCQIFARNMYPERKELEVLFNKLEIAGIQISAVGLYCSLLRTDERVMGNTFGDAVQLIERISDFGKYNYIVWSGTFADDLLRDHDDNHTIGGWKILAENTSRMFDTVLHSGDSLFIEPYWAHVIRDTETYVRLRELIGSDKLKIVLDVPNVISPGSFNRMDGIIQRECSAARYYTGIVHLKDIDGEEGGSLGYPSAGRGSLNYSLYIGELVRSEYDVCAVIEHVNSFDEYENAKSFIDGIFDSL
jgi:sugar phosphate isomerase/epimerase